MLATYNVYRGEFPFTDVIGYVYAPSDEPNAALKEAIKLCNTPVVNPDVFMRHPVVSLSDIQYPVN